MKRTYMDHNLHDARQSLRPGMKIILGNLAKRGLPGAPAECKRVDFSHIDPNPADSHSESEWTTVDTPEVVSRSGTHRATAA